MFYINLTFADIYLEVLNEKQLITAIATIAIAIMGSATATITSFSLPMSANVPETHTYQNAATVYPV